MKGKKKLKIVGRSRVKPTPKSGSKSASKSAPKSTPRPASKETRRKNGREYRQNKRGQWCPVTFNYQPKNPADSAERKMNWLRAFAKTGSVTQATIDIGSHRTTVYRWREADQDFADAWDEIWRSKIDNLEQSLMNRAINGHIRPIYQQGVRVGEEVVHHPQLGMFLLSKLRAGQYGEVKESAVASPAEYAAKIREHSAAQDAEAKRALERRKEQS